jgi:hypothetical protein
MVCLKNINHLTLKDMIENIQLYSGLPDGLIQLPLPDSIKINSKALSIPGTMEELSKMICYGQRLFLVRKEDNDFGAILRVMDGYYYTLSTKQKWDEDKALLFGKKILTLLVKDLYPVAMHMITLVGEVINKEQELLYREPTKIEKAAGIDKLNVFSELSSLYFLRDTLKVTIPEVLLTPYNECLVLFMKAKTESDYMENYNKEIQELSKIKNKFK